MFGAILQAAEFFTKLNEGKGKNSDQYPALKTELTNPEEWWDSLNHDQKVQVGGICVHCDMMSANYKWNCGNGGLLYKDLKKGQQKLIKFALSIKDKNYEVIDLLGACGLRRPRKNSLYDRFVR